MGAHGKNKWENRVKWSKRRKDLRRTQVLWAKAMHESGIGNHGRSGVYLVIEDGDRKQKGANQPHWRVHRRLKPAKYCSEKTSSDKGIKPGACVGAVSFTLTNHRLESFCP